MSKNSFKVLRPGINTTFQDLGRDNLYHVGLPFSGAIDKRNFLIANSLITNKEDDAVLEFAYQGPLLEFSGSQTSIVITGNVNLVGSLVKIFLGELPIIFHPPGLSKV